MKGCAFFWFRLRFCFGSAKQHFKPGICGYDADDHEKMEGLRETVMNRDGWENLTAVKNDQVYLIDSDLVGSTANFVGAT